MHEHYVDNHSMSNMWLIFVVIIIIAFVSLILSLLTYSQYHTDTSKSFVLIGKNSNNKELKDVGFISYYTVDGERYQTGFYFDSTDKRYKLFNGLETDILSNNLNKTVKDISVTHKQLSKLDVMNIGVDKGFVTSPSIFFHNDPTTGIYQTDLKTFCIGVSGVNRININSTLTQIDSVNIQNGSIYPISNNTVNLGLSNLQWKNIYVGNRLVVEGIEFGASDLTNGGFDQQLNTSNDVQFNKLIVDSTDSEAFTIRQNGDGTDIFSVNTSTSTVNIIGNINIGSTLLGESELKVLDAVTPGTVSASKALIADASRDISAINNIFMEGTLTMNNVYPSQPNNTILNASYTDISTNVYSCDMRFAFNALSIRAGFNSIPNQGKVYITDKHSSGSLSEQNLAEIYLGAATVNINGTLTCDTSFTIDDTSIIENDLKLLSTGLIAGVVTANKVVTVDANRDVTTLRNVTSDGTVTAAALNLGETNLNWYEETNINTTWGGALPSIASTTIHIVRIGKQVVLTVVQNLENANSATTITNDTAIGVNYRPIVNVRGYVRVRDNGTDIANGEYVIDTSGIITISKTLNGSFLGTSGSGTSGFYAFSHSYQVS